MQAAYGFEIVRNRFVSRLNGDSSAYRDRYVIQLGDTNQYAVQGGRIAHNAFAPTGTTQPINGIYYYGANSTYLEEFGNPRTSSGVTGFGMRTGSGGGLAQSIPVDNGAALWLRLGSGGTLPAAASGYRGQIRVLQGGAGAADVLYTCIKNASDAYEWKVISLA